MQEITILISDLFFSLNEIYRIFFIFLFAYGEGLPVIGSILPGGTIALLVGTLSTSGFIVPLYAILLYQLEVFLVI